MMWVMMLPVLLPMFTGALLLLFSQARLRWKRRINTVASLSLVPLAIWAVMVADQGINVVALGNWMPPFGIVLVLDRFSAMMLLITAVLAVPAGLSMDYGLDRRGQNFQALFQFQLMGINGAFLTGDLFNLFVFFEILLIASYALMVHSLGRERLAAGLHYVIVNLVGSVLFLVAAGLIYGLTGTLNLADLALRLQQLPANDIPLAKAAGALLLMVFALKAAVLPIGMWLPATYAAASAPIAALFAIMTKVGVYAIVRVHSLWFGEGADAFAGFGQAVIGGVGVVTLLVASVGVLGARRLQEMLAWLALVSVGTMLSVWAFASPQATTAMLYYLLHSTWIGGAMFLVCGVIAQQRGQLADALTSGPQPAGTWLALSFLMGAVALAGLPPLSGFVGKVLILQTANDGFEAIFFWLGLIGSGAAALIAFTRAGTTLFWRSDATPQTPRLEQRQPFGPVLMLLPFSVLLAVFAEPVLVFLQAASADLHTPQVYIDAVMGLSTRGQS